MATKNAPKKNAPKTISVDVGFSFLETRGGTRAKKGDTIQIPADREDQSPAVRWGLKSGNLRARKAEMDLATVTSSPSPEE